jgi:hypothetical protein
MMLGTHTGYGRVFILAFMTCASAFNIAFFVKTPQNQRCMLSSPGNVVKHPFLGLRRGAPKAIYMAVGASSGILESTSPAGTLLR